MTVFVLIQEHQNEHGYVDTSIAGVFHHEHVAREQEAIERRHAREQGLIVEDDDSRAQSFKNLSGTRESSLDRERSAKCPQSNLTN